LSPRTLTSLFYICIFLSYAVEPAAAQAPIDPSLPDAPLEHKREMPMFAGYGTVTDPDTPVAPMRTRQKFEMATLMSIDPSLFIRAGMLSVYDEALQVGPNYGSGAGGFWKLYGYNSANIASSYFFGDAVVPAIFHQDPRYFRKGTGSAKSRIWWALRSQVIAFSDKGTEMPNYGSMLGLGMSAALSNAYMPPQNISFGKTMEGFAIKQGVKAGLDISREFGGLGRLMSLMKRPH
jgi:hypothetical protein